MAWTQHALGSRMTARSDNSTLLASATVKAVGLGVITVAFLGGVRASAAEQERRLTDPQLATCLAKEERLIAAARVRDFEVTSNGLVRRQDPAESLRPEEWLQQAPQEFEKACDTTLASLELTRGAGDLDNVDSEAGYEDLALLLLSSGLTLSATRMGRRHEIAERLNSAARQFESAVALACKSYENRDEKNPHLDTMKHQRIILYEKFNDIVQRYPGIKKFCKKDSDRDRLRVVASRLEDDFSELDDDSPPDDTTRKRNADTLKERAASHFKASSEVAGYLRHVELTNYLRRVK